MKYKMKYIKTLLPQEGVNFQDVNRINSVFAAGAETIIERMIIDPKSNTEIIQNIVSIKTLTELVHLRKVEIDKENN